MPQPRSHRRARHLVGLLALAAAGAQAAAHPCATEADPVRRLACYDAAFPPISTTATPGAGTAASGAAPAADRGGTRTDGIAGFGLDDVGQRARSERQAGPDRIEATLAALDRRQNGARLFTLDNGQVWAEVEATIRGQVAVGDRLEIRKASFGTYLLVTPGRASLRVRRIR